MSGPGNWMGRLEAEIGGELGQTVALAAGGQTPSPAGSFVDTIEVPGARLMLTADALGVAAFLAAARVIEQGQADAETVRELWSGILASVAGRLGGKATPSGTAPETAEACVLSLEGAALQLGLQVDALAKGTAAATAGAAPQGAAAAPPPPPQRIHERVPERIPERAPGNFDLLFEVELEASVRFGSREMELRELLELGPGDVVELDRHVADPVDLIVGDRIVARGEVVLVNGNFGLRVTDVAEPVRRLESIRCLW
jgi:flagellar motor switch protein FliN/FliY